MKKFILENRFISVIVSLVIIALAFSVYESYDNYSFTSVKITDVLNVFIAIMIMFYVYLYKASVKDVSRRICGFLDSIILEMDHFAENMHDQEKDSRKLALLHIKKMNNLLELIKEYSEGKEVNGKLTELESFFRDYEENITDNISDLGCMDVLNYGKKKNNVEYRANKIILEILKK